MFGGGGANGECLERTRLVEGQLVLEDYIVRASCHALAGGISGIFKAKLNHWRLTEDPGEESSRVSNCGARRAGKRVHAADEPIRGRAFGGRW